MTRDDRFAEKFVDLIMEEKTRFRALHGRGDPRVDVWNTRNDWISYIIRYLGKAVSCKSNIKEPNSYVGCMVSAAALILIALEDEEYPLRFRPEYPTPEDKARWTNGDHI